ncbi:hypothetical protein SCUCBS95973_007331 [Sporothrix curviconia]|uniref:NB-ARC domain-containing protein n=1 Tax=Sporothrix curviconia TaxID=1260050 RepID=A0ABP0CD60_9PEZI
MVEPNIVAVPGFGTPSTNTWGIDEELQGAAQPLGSVSRFHNYTYQSSYNPSNEFSWSEFIQTGRDLAEELARLAVDALLLAHQNVQDSRFQLLLQCLSGILFMGTPHSVGSDNNTYMKFNEVLYSCANVAARKRTRKLPDDGVRELANLAARFEQIATMPILSVYETGRDPGSFFRRKSKAIVDKQFATISSKAEQLLGVDLAHPKLCELSHVADNSLSARTFLRSLCRELADNETFGNTAAPDGSPSAIASQELPVADPLNPLNLAPVLPQADAAQRLYQGSVPAPTPLDVQLPLRLRLGSAANTSLTSLLSTREARLPCFMLSQEPNPDFVGRQDILEQMDRHLLQRRSSPGTAAPAGVSLFALCGMGGLGKTDLAVEYAHTRRAQFDAVFWLEAGGQAQLASDFGRIATELGLQTQEESESLESNIEVAKAWLAVPRTDDRRWLLIFDNADKLDIIEPYVPLHGQGAVLITSRDSFAKDPFFANGAGVDLDPLAAADAAGLLRRLIAPDEAMAAAPVDGEAYDEADDEADELAASVEVATFFGSLPLAMTQMAGVIRRRRLSIRDFAEIYTNDARYDDIHNVKTPHLGRRYDNTLASMYNFEGVGGQAKALLRLLAFLNPDRVQEDIFVRPRRSTTTTSSSSSKRWTSADFDKARYELITSSLIKRNIPQRELWIHRIVQAEVRREMDEPGRYQAFCNVVLLLAELWPPGDHSSQKITRWALCGRLLPHLERLYQLHLEYAEAWAPFAVDPAFPVLMNEAATYLHERGFSHEGKPYLRLGLSLCARAGITLEPLISDMHLCMGALCNETNDKDGCLEHNIQCLAIRRQHAVKGRPDLRLAFAHSQMGIAYMMVGKFASATAYFQQSVEMLKSIPGIDLDEFGFPSCNLGLAYWIQGDIDTADTVLTDLLAQREMLHGKLDRVSYKTGRVLHALGNVRASKAIRLEAQAQAQADADATTSATPDLADQAKIYWDQAFAIHTDCLAQYESTVGKFNHRTADALHKLAEHHIRRKEHVQAQACLERALSIWGDRVWYRNESARSSYLRGIHLLSLGGEKNTAEGERWVQRAKALRRAILPDEDEPQELDTTDFDSLICFWSI